MAGETNHAEGSNRREVYFKLASLLFAIFLIALFEGALRLFSYGDNLHLVVSHNNRDYKDFYMVNPHVGKKYFNRLEATSTVNDIFLKQKPENGFRIFVMGSSTVYGYPYDNNPMASRILHRRLEEAYPDQTVEVVNTAITAINTITLRDYIGQILKHEPDAILIYAGHNEFYGAFGVGSNETMSRSAFLRSLNFTMMNLRIAQLVKSGINGISRIINKTNGAGDSRGTLMKRIVGDKEIPYGSEKYKAGIDQFREHMSFILKRAHKKDVPVFLSDLVCNIKDLPPFGDIPGIDLSAKTAYLDARKVLSDGDTLRAKELFSRARDLDPVRFRASEEINQIIGNLAGQPGVTLIPAEKWFSNASPGGLIGNNLITEHVHPNIEGQFLLADAFFTAIAESGLIHEYPDPYTTRNKAYYRRNWAYTTLDSLAGAFKIEQLKSYWPFTSLEVDQTFRDTFSPSGIIDSLAFTILINPDANIALLHEFLGNHYEKNQQLPLACREYESLVNYDPYRSDYYQRAANCQLKLNDLHAAEIYLRKSILYGESSFAYTMLGEIEGIKHNYQGAMDAYASALEAFNEESKEDKELIQAALATASQKVNGKGRGGAFTYSRYVPYNIENLYSKALYHLNSGSDSSLFYLLSCLKINDCPLVNWQIGNILFQKQDEKVLYFYNKAYAGFSKNADFLSQLFIANMVNDNTARAGVVLGELIACDPSNKNIPRFEAALKEDQP